MFYEKKIKYLNYYENDIRIKGAGYVRLEARDRSLRMELTVTGLHPTDSFVRDVFLCAGKEEKAVGTIPITGGTGQLRLQWPDATDIAGMGISYSSLQGIRIPLGTGREISCLWQEPQKKSGKNIPLDGERDDLSSRRPLNGAKPLASGTDVPAERTADTEFPSKDAAGPGLSAGNTAAAAFAAKSSADHTGVTTEAAAHAGNMPESIVRSGLSAKEAPAAKGSANAGFTAKSTAGTDLKAESISHTALTAGSAAGIKFNARDAATHGLTAESAIGTKFSAGDDANPGFSSRSNADANSSTRSVAGSGRITESGAGADMQSQRIIAAKRPDRKQWEELRKEPGKKAAPVLDQSEIREGSRAPRDHRGELTRLLDDKWQQLWSIYPHVRPFRDKREYLSIRPADFVIFSSPSYRLVNNSFLLHGYYNYKHLILTRVERKGEVYYYIGVPGSFFEKEKQVAIMFGFESFECAEEPAQAGDFGYYMMRTEI